MSLNIKNNKFLIPCFIFILAFLPRILVAVAVSNDFTNIPVNDAIGYDDLATSISTGKGFALNGTVTAWREPLYPGFLATVYFLFGHNYLTVRIIQALLGTLVCVIVFIIGKTIFDSRIGFISALITSFNPALVKISSLLLSENLYILLLAVSMVILLKYAKKNKLSEIIYLGIFLGLTALTRSIAIFLPLFIAVIIVRSSIFESILFKRKILHIIVFWGVVFLTILPWTLRNWFVFHKFVPLTSRNGMGLYLSYVPKDGNKFELDPKDPVVIKADAMWESIKSETEQNKFYITETIKHISLNPQSLPRIEALKIIYFCNPFDWEVNNKGEYNFVYGFIMPFFLYSLFFVLKKERNAFILFVPILYSLFLALITHGSPRFRLPIEPYLIIISSYGLVYFFQGFRHKVYPVIIVLFFLLINLTFSINPEAVKPIIKAILKPLNIV